MILSTAKNFPFAILIISSTSFDENKKSPLLEAKNPILSLVVNFTSPQFPQNCQSYAIRQNSLYMEIIFHFTEHHGNRLGKTNERNGNQWWEEETPFPWTDNILSSSEHRRVIIMGVGFGWMPSSHMRHQREIENAPPEAIPRRKGKHSNDQTTRISLRQQQWRHPWKVVWVFQFQSMKCYAVDLRARKLNTIRSIELSILLNDLTHSHGTA